MDDSYNKLERIGAPIMDSIFIDENTFVKCGEVFRNGKGKHHYQCILCALILEEAIEFEQHTSIHFNLLLEPVSNETTTTSVPANAEDEPELYFQKEPGRDEVFPIGIKMVIVDKLPSLDTNNSFSVELPEDKTAPIEIAPQIRTKDLQTHQSLHSIKNTYKSPEVFPNYGIATEHIANHCKAESVHNDVESPDSNADFTIAKPFKFEFFETDLALKYATTPMTFHSNDELSAHTIIQNKPIAPTEIECKIELVDSSEFPVPPDDEKKQKKKKTKGPFVCSICEKPFRSRHAITLHLNMHNGIRPHKCEQCSKTFTRIHHLKEHLFIHRDRQFQCATCSKAFKTKRTLKRHMETHLPKSERRPPRKQQKRRKITPLIMGTCDICGKITNLNILKIHMRRHTAERPYKCKLCPKAYSQCTLLTEHMRTHAGIRSIKCSLCPKTFITDSQLNYHKRWHFRQTNGIAPQRDPCYVCGRKVVNMTAHLKTHMPVERSHKCEICEKTYTSQKYLRAHKLVHSDERPYDCHLCSKTFKTPNHKAAHLRVHSGTVKMYPCNLCEYLAYDKERLNIHVRMRHTGHRPFDCDHCDANFASKKTLRQHQKLHLNEK